MIPGRLMTDSVTIVYRTPQTANRYGRDVLEEASRATVPAWMQETARTEQAGEAEITEVVYTMFLNDSELEHAQEIITSLINAILDPIQPPILVNRIEGDAVFAYTTDNAFLQGQTLLESMKKLLPDEEAFEAAG